jgi:hypothetical protein
VGAFKPTPSPVLVRRFASQGGWHDTYAGILGLTKMDCNNNTLYKGLSVTLGHPKAFADMIQQNPTWWMRCTASEFHVRSSRAYEAIAPDT